MKLLSTLFLTSLILLLGCEESRTNNRQKPEESVELNGSHTSKNSLDWQGIYSGVMPCASCEGIETAITLSDSTYSLSMIYLGENEPNAFKKDGNFSWNEAGNTITLENEDEPNQYFVGENYLAKLDMHGNRITGELANKYVLRKK